MRAETFMRLAMGIIGIQDLLKGNLAALDLLAEHGASMTSVSGLCEGFLALLISKLR